MDRTTPGGPVGLRRRDLPPGCRPMYEQAADVIEGAPVVEVRSTPDLRIGRRLLGDYVVQAKVGGVWRTLIFSRGRGRHGVSRYHALADALTQYGAVRRHVEAAQGAGGGEEDGDGR